MKRASEQDLSFLDDDFIDFLADPKQIRADVGRSFSPPKSYDFNNRHASICIASSLGDFIQTSASKLKLFDSETYVQAPRRILQGAHLRQVGVWQVYCLCASI